MVGEGVAVLKPAEMGAAAVVAVKDGSHRGDERWILRFWRFSRTSTG